MMESQASLIGSSLSCLRAAAAEVAAAEAADLASTEAVSRVEVAEDLACHQCHLKTRRCLRVATNNRRADSLEVVLVLKLVANRQDREAKHKANSKALVKLMFPAHSLPIHLQAFSQCPWQPEQFPPAR